MRASGCEIFIITQVEIFITGISRSHAVLIVSTDGLRSKLLFIINYATLILLLSTFGIDFFSCFFGCFESRLTDELSIGLFDFLDLPLFFCIDLILFPFLAFSFFNELSLFLELHVFVFVSLHFFLFVMLELDLTCLKHLFQNLDLCFTNLKPLSILLYKSVSVFLTKINTSVIAELWLELSLDPVE